MSDLWAALTRPPSTSGNWSCNKDATEIIRFLNPICLSRWTDLFSHHLKSSRFQRPRNAKPIIPDNWQSHAYCPRLKLDQFWKLLTYEARGDTGAEEVFIATECDVRWPHVPTCHVSHIRVVLSVPGVRGHVPYWTRFHDYDLWLAIETSIIFLCRDWARLRNAGAEAEPGDNPVTMPIMSNGIIL